jgi:putative adhesin/cell wall-active antibiotic response 4TMS protein YvqF
MRRTIGSIFWGLTLVVIGGLLLARNLGYPIPIWSVLARYWPVLIIGWGLVKLFEYFHYRRTGNNGPLFSGGEVALLILVLLAGSAITTAANVSANIDGVFDVGDLDLWDITGNNYSYDEHHELPVSGTPAIDIVNMFGNVDVRASDSDKVVVDVRKTVRASNKEEADRLSSDFVFRIVNDGSSVRVASSQDPSGPTDGRRIGRQRFKSSLTVYVPKASPVKVDNRNGKVSVQDLAASQNVTNRFGEVEVQRVEGDVEVSNSFGSTTVLDTAGAINVRARYGEVRVDLETPPQKNISVSLDFGDVRLRLPANASFGLEAQTAFGDVRSEFGALTENSSNRRERSMKGTVGEGGPQINVKTRFGDIRLQKRG